MSAFAQEPFLVRFDRLSPLWHVRPDLSSVPFFRGSVAEYRPSKAQRPRLDDLLDVQLRSQMSQLKAGEQH